MKGDPAVIEILNEVLTSELTAINQYFIHAKMCEDWGYQKLAKQKREESIGEMKHADELIERILYLDGVPNMQRMSPVKVGEDIVEQHKNDLVVETDAIARLNRGIDVCVAKKDNGTREMLESILKSEEEGADHIEAQLHIINEIGVEAYLAEQIHD